MEVVVNTVKRRRKPNDDEEGTGLKKAFVPRSAKDLAKMQFDKLMKDPVSISRVDDTLFSLYKKKIYKNIEASYKIAKEQWKFKNKQ